MGPTIATAKLPKNSTKISASMAKPFLVFTGFSAVSYTHLDVYKRQPQGSDYRKSVPACLEGKEGTEALKANMARLEVCCQKGLSERFDASIGAGTVLMPFAGKYQLTPEAVSYTHLPRGTLNK